jgi:membrane protease YdiL (CAAX protease family)
MTALDRKKRGFWHRHGLGITALFVLILWTVLYCLSNPSTHWGSFFGNAIADWSGVVVTVYATKYLYEIGSSESRRPNPTMLKPLLLWLYDHSLSLFLLITGIGWIALFARSDPQGKWGQVVGNIVSEWTQIFGLVLLTKKLIEMGSKESRGGH